MTFHQRTKRTCGHASPISIQLHLLLLYYDTPGLWVDLVTFASGQQKYHNAKNKMSQSRIRFLNELDTEVHFTLFPTHTHTHSEETWPIHSHLLSISPLCPCPSDWEAWKGFVWLHQVISIITTSLAAAYQPFLTYLSLHVSIHSYLTFTYLYFSSFPCLYHTCLCPSWRTLEFFLSSLTLTLQSPSLGLRAHSID